MGPGRYGGRRPGPAPAGVLEAEPEAPGPPMAPAGAADSRGGGGGGGGGEDSVDVRSGVAAPSRWAHTPSARSDSDHPVHAALTRGALSLGRLQASPLDWKRVEPEKRRARAHTHTCTHACEWSEWSPKAIGAIGASKRRARAHTHTYTQTDGRADGRTHARTHAARTHARTRPAPCSRLVPARLWGGRGGPATARPWGGRGRGGSAPAVVEELPGGPGPVRLAAP